MRTRLRRYIWSSFRPGGSAMEYTGDPWEKLLGFCIAVVVLTFYIGILNLVLMFVSFSVFENSIVGYALSFAGLIPLWFYASYRSRRYVLGRTRWRGVRFALEPGAWGYTGRALMHWAITIVSLGLLAPRMTFYLEKFRTDRTVFGDMRLTQGGSWWMLYRAMIPLLVVAAATGGYVWWLWVGDPLVSDPEAVKLVDIFDDDNLTTEELMSMPGLNAPERLLWVFAIIAALIYALVHYYWASRRILANHKTAGGLGFVSKLRAPRMFWIYCTGYFIASWILILGIFAVVVATAVVLGAERLTFATEFGVEGLEHLPEWVSYVAIGLLYFAVFLLWAAVHMAFITYPMQRHMALSLALSNVGGLAEVSQRKRDAFAEAEGFAEALDLGAAI